MFEHGDCIITNRDGIVYVTLEGSFNDLAVHNCIDKMKRLLESEESETFSMLVSYEGLAGGTPEAYQISNDFNKWLNEEKKLYKKAIVSNNDLVVDISLRLQDQLRKQNIRVFSSKKDALKWLKT